MNRRKFFGTLIGGVAAGAAVRTWPFRVFSFPTDPRINVIIEVEAAMAKAMKEFSDELTRIMYTDGVGTGLTGIRLYETPPYPPLHFVGLERSTYPGRVHASMVCTKVDQKRKEITFAPISA